MILEKLVLKYLASTEQVLIEMETAKDSINIDVENIQMVVDHVKAYLEDAKYYKSRRKFEVSLASVAYCEGLLDALRLLGAVKFKWSAERRKEK